MTILVVDDSLLIRLSMKSIIEELGHSVILASNGKQSIDMYKENKVDIVTMDLSMPEMSGCDAIKHLIEIDSNAKIIISTANSFSDSILTAIKEGALCYILKPVTIDILKDAIDKATNDPKQ